MSKQSIGRRAVMVLFAGGSLLAGPCGITTLQLQDFTTSTLIRTLVGTTAQIVESIIIQNAGGTP